MALASPHWPLYIIGRTMNRSASAAVSGCAIGVGYNTEAQVLLIHGKLRSALVDLKAQKLIYLAAVDSNLVEHQITSAITTASFSSQTKRRYDIAKTTSPR